MRRSIHRDSAGHRNGSELASGPHVTPSLHCDKLCDVGTNSSFEDFWPEYVRAHSLPGTRAIHLAGTLAGWLILILALALQHWWWIGAALVVSYGLAWISHFFVEHNRPASFEHPLWSWWADQKMVALVLTGKWRDTRV